VDIARGTQQAACHRLGITSCENAEPVQFATCAITRLVGVTVHRTAFQDFLAAPGF